MNIVTILIWLAFGALVGWVASLIMGKNGKMGLLANIIVGLVGSVIGGWLANLLHIADGQAIFTFAGAAMSVLGAVVLLFIINPFVKKK